MRITPVLVMVVAATGCPTQFGGSTQQTDVRSGGNALVRTQPANAVDGCVQGGIHILGGTDHNGDGALGDDEVTTRSLVCHGEPGAPGMQGSAGLAGTNGRDSPLLALNCAQGQGPVFSVDAGAWQCANDGDTLGALQCAAGAVARFNGQVWTCGTDNVAQDTLALLRDSCGAGQVATYDGTQWRCGVDRDVDTLAAVTCAQAGDVLQWTGSTWTCGPAPDQDTLGALACQAGQIAKWNGTAWRCDQDRVSPPGVDTLASLNCAVGQVARFDGVNWVCAADGNALGFSCAEGQVAKWNATSGSWSCGADVDTNTLAALSCSEGQIPKRVGTSWACANDDNALALGCTNGQVARWSGAGWSCGVDVDTNTLGALACAPNELAKWNGTAWQCAADAVAAAGTDTLAFLGCLAGQVAKFNGTSWVCAADDNALAVSCADGQVAKWNGLAWGCGVDVDTNTLGSLACSNGQVAKWNGSAWACAADDNALSITCSNGQVPKWSGLAWGCGVDVDTNTLGSLACSNGQVAKWNGSAWACAADDNALTVSCVDGQVPKWSGTGWACAVDVDTNTLGSLACSNGQVAKWNGSAWACAADDNALSITCSNGQVAKWSGTGWSCGVDVDTNTLASLACSNGQLAKWNGSAWACAADDNALSITCSNGQVPKWSGTGWTCGADNDVNTLGALACSNGQVAKWNGSAWACAADNDALSITCSNGQVAKWNGAGWSCGADNDTNTLGGLACSNGQVAKFNGSAWACAVDNDSLSISCANGQVPKWSGTGWACGADADTLTTLSCAAGEVPKLVGGVFSCEPDADALAALACPDGQIPKRAGGAWTCGVDAIGAGSLFARTFIVAPGATALDSGNNLRTTLSGITASAASPALVYVEPGTYNLDSTPATIPQYVTLKGGGRTATIIQAVNNALVSSGNTELSDLRVTANAGSAIFQNGAAGLLRVRRVSVNTNASNAARGISVTGAGLDLDDVDITITSSGNPCYAVLVNNIGTLGVRIQNLRVTLTNCSDPRGISGGTATIHVGEILLRGVDITATGGTGSTSSIRLAYFGKTTLEDVSVRQDSTPSLSVPEDEGIAVFGNNQVLSDVRVDVRGSRQGVGLSISSPFAGAQVVARNVEVITSGSGANIRGANFYIDRADVDGLRIRLLGNSDFGIAHSFASGVGRFRAVHIEKVTPSTAVGFSNGPNTTSTFMHGSIKGPGTGLSRNPTAAVVELFASQVEGAIPAADANFKCATSYSATFTQLAGCTF